MSPQSLPEIARAELVDPIEPHVLVTFLNRTLKRRGLIFGIARQGEKFLLTVYATEPWSGEEPGD